MGRMNLRCYILVQKIMSLSTFVFYYQFKMFCISPKEFFSIESKFGKKTKNQPYISETVVEILISQAITLSSLVAIRLVKINIYWSSFVTWPHVTYMVRGMCSIFFGHVTPNQKWQLKSVTIYYKVWQFNSAGFFDIFCITKFGEVILLQNVSGITKCDRLLLQSVSGITKCDRLLLQSVSGITKCDRLLLKSVTDFYYKVCQVL